MNSPRNLREICAEWRQLAQAEARAIAAADWLRLAQHQAGIRNLQGEIDFALQQMDPASARRQKALLRPMIDELMQCVRANAGALAARRSNLEAERVQLTRNSRSLCQVRRAYGQKAVTLWQSYS